MQQPPRKIEISVPAQELRLLEGDQIVRTWPVSTSKYGTGSEEGSYKTPLGRFRVAECIGGGEPERTIFKSRLPVGRWEPETASPDEGDLVLTRILWLDGQEEQNANAHARYIYIHGTNHEEDIGKPASIGCIRMRNPDVVELFEAVQPGVEVEIIA